MAATVPVLGAEELSIDLDPKRTTISFVLSDVLHTVRGDFALKNGHISFDPDSNEISGEIVIDAASGNSGNGARDKRMTRDILEAQRYADIRFKPVKIKGSISRSGISSSQVTGSFVIHGQAHEITIPMQIQMYTDALNATGHFTVPYVQWGMKNPSRFLLKVADKVEIDLNVMAHIKRGNTTVP